MELALIAVVAVLDPVSGRDNPFAIGAQLRVGTGPAREIRAGSAYWSVDDPVTVLSLPAGENAHELWIRWPGGTEQRVPLQPGQRDVRVARPSRLDAGIHGTQRDNLRDEGSRAAPRSHARAQPSASCRSRT